jgi:ABC-2 type transport system permease protein
MNAIFNARLAWLIRREYWEERAGFLRAQVILACILVALSILGIIAFEVFQARMGSNLHINSSLSRALQNGLSKNTRALVGGLDATMLTFGAFSAIVLFFSLFFYLLGALYNDRRDRSILFWKSLPISDTSTAVSKVIAAVLIAPVIAAVVVLAGYLAQQIVSSLWFLAHGVNPLTLIWAHTSPFSVWLHLLATIPINAVWALPTIGWLLLWSAAVRSKPFLWAVTIPIIAGVLNFWISLLGLPHAGLRFFWSEIVGRALLSVFPGSWMATSRHADLGDYLSHMSEASGHLGSYGTMYSTFLTPNIWIGAAVGVFLIALAIWLRRWRTEV